MDQQAEYLMPARSLCCETEVKKSRFIACAFQLNQRQQLQARLLTLQQEYPDARHYCWAYLIGHPVSASSAGMNDDGEPSGTAGRPILNVIQHKKIGDVLVVVVRYFGGIKLGAGGLTRAYSAATEAVLSQLPLEPYIAQHDCWLQLDFAHEHALRHWVQQHEGQLLQVEYPGTVVRAHVQIPQALMEALQQFCHDHAGMQLLSTETQAGDKPVAR